MGSPIAANPQSHSQYIYEVRSTTSTLDPELQRCKGALQEQHIDRNDTESIRNILHMLKKIRAAYISSVWSCSRNSSQLNAADVRNLGSMCVAEKLLDGNYSLPEIEKLWMYIPANWDRTDPDIPDASGQEIIQPWLRSADIPNDSVAALIDTFVDDLEFCLRVRGNQPKEIADANRAHLAAVVDLVIGGLEIK